MQVDLMLLLTSYNNLFLLRERDDMFREKKLIVDIMAPDRCNIYTNSFSTLFAVSKAHFT